MNVRAKYLVVTLLIVLALIVSWDYLFWRGRFPPNTFIEKLDVSGMSRYEALNRLRTSSADELSTWPITVDLEGKMITGKPSDFGIYLSPRRTINNTLTVAFRRNYIVDLYKRLLDRYPKRIIPLSLEVERRIYGAILEGWANGFDVACKDATFTLPPDRGMYRITKEQVGKSIDVLKSIENMEVLLSRGIRNIPVEVKVTAPRIYAKTLVKYPPKYLLSEFTTYFGSHDSPNRVHNIKLSSSRTNNYILASGEVFSLLSLLGDFSGDSGYKEAFVLTKGELEPQYGGGSCQIASTLYNAALLAGLETVERYNHGIYFTIYPFGRDASIYSPARDLKFRNNTNHPIYVKAYATDRKLTYRIYGTPTGKKVSFSRPMVFFEGERYKVYNVSSDEARDRINKALLSGQPFYTYVTVMTELAGYRTEKIIFSHYKLTGDRENVRVVRPEPQ